MKIIMSTKIYNSIVYYSTIFNLLDLIKSDVLKKVHQNEGTRNFKAKWFYSTYTTYPLHYLIQRYFMKTYEL